MGAVVAIALGGALGAVARYGLGGSIQRASGSAFPWGTLTVNVIGSLAIGFLIVWLQASQASEELRAFAIVGVLGGFTTFSAFSYETVALAQSGLWTRAAAYALGSVAICVIAVLGGMAAAQAVLRRG